MIFAVAGMEEAAKEKLVDKRFSVFCSYSRAEARRQSTSEGVGNKGTWIPESAMRASTKTKFLAYLAELTEHFPEEQMEEAAVEKI